MKLSTAIRLGSLLVDNPTRCDWNTCALGMAARAVGIESRPADFYARWPWLETTIDCPKCGCLLVGSAVVWHLFDTHIMHYKDMTIDQLADWIATIEPKDEVNNEVSTPATVDVLSCTV